MAYNLEAILKFKDQSSRGRKQAEGGFKDLEKTVKRVGLAMVAAFGADMVFDLAKVGATAERVEKRFSAFAREAGGAEAILAAFQKGAGGAASEMQAMESASRLLQMGLVGSTSEMEQMVEMGTRLGNQTQSIGDRMGDFAALLANQSIPRLDNFGISSGRVRQRIKELTEQLGKTREEAFKLAVLEEGAKSLEILGERSDDSLTSFEKLEAQMTDLKVEIGQGLAPVVTLLVGGFLDLLEAAGPAIDLMKDFAETIAGMPKPAEAAAAGLEQVGEATASWLDEGLEAADMASVLAERVNKAGQEVGRLGGRIKLSAGDYKNLGKAIKEGVGVALLETSRSYDEYLRRTDEFNAKVKVAEWQVKAFSKAQFATVRSTELLAQEEEYLNQVISASVQHKEEAVQITHDYAASFDAATMSERNFATSVDAVAGALGVQVAAERQAAAEVTARAEAQRAASEQVAAAVLKQKAALDEAARSQAALASEMFGATEEMVKQKTFALIDPAAIGVEAWASLGVELGFMDEKAAALAVSVPMLTDAVNAGIVPTENFTVAFNAMMAAASEGQPITETMLDQFARAPGLIGPSKEKLDQITQSMHLMTAAGSPAATAMADVGGAMGPVESATRGANTELSSAHTNLQRLAREWRIKIIYETVGTPPPGGGFQMGGIVPGPIGQRRRITAHGGEIVLNPFQPGALGGPTDNRQYHDSTVNNIYNPRAEAMAMAQKRNRRRARFEARM